MYLQHNGAIALRQGQSWFSSRVNLHRQRLGLTLESSCPLTDYSMSGHFHISTCVLGNEPLLLLRPGTDLVSGTLRQWFFGSRRTAVSTAGCWYSWENNPTRDSWEHVGAPERALRGGSYFPRILGSHCFRHGSFR